jgi:hypothetical protein
MKIGRIHRRPRIMQVTQSETKSCFVL